MDFLINGFPENESHENKSNTNSLRNKKNSGIDSELENLMKTFGFDINGANIDFSSLNSAMGSSGNIDKILQDMLNTLGTIMGGNNSGNQQKTVNISNSENDGKVDSSSFENGVVEAFIADGKSFASVPVSFEEDFKETFLKDFNISNEDNFNISKIKDASYFSIDFPVEKFFGDFDSASLIGFSDAYLLFSANPSDSNKLGIFFAIVRSCGNYTIVVPKYGNTYKTFPEIDLFDNENDPEYFDNGTFKYLNVSQLRLALEWMFIKEKSTVLTPDDLGTIKQYGRWEEKTVRNHTFYKIGYIMLNESDATKQFMKDLDITTKSIPFYIRVTDKDFSSLDLYKLLSNTEFNGSSFIKNSDIKYMQGMSYVDMPENGEMLKFLHKIVRNNVDKNDYLY